MAAKAAPISRNVRSLVSQLVSQLVSKQIKKKATEGYGRLSKAK